MNDRAEIQAQDASGNWRTYSVMTNTDSQRMNDLMKELSNRYPNYRIRAVDQNGRVLNIL